ncbi:hypothetical protein MNBD_GAMMA11-2758 [hydrothermal vent metagenome]|uniref:Uncharacterized protein n=1 Tax=hydrothermal vent metagenome TaxID=652676 RepID=A0A3B0WW13_9ZZZZ
MSTKRISILEILLWIFVLILILLSFTPFALGFKIKADYTRLVTDMAEILQVDLQILNYEQGLFSSEATLAIKLPDKQISIKFKEEIVHGPIYFGVLSQGRSPLVAAVVKGQIDISAEKQVMVQKVFVNKVPLVYQHIIDFAGDVETQAYIPSVNTSFNDDEGTVSVQSSGMVINEHFSAASRQLSGDAKIPTLKIKTPTYSINVDGINLSFSGGIGKNQIVIGDSVISLNLFDIVSGAEQFTLRDFTIRSITSETGNLISSGSNISALEVFASNQKFGPIKLDLNLNGVSAQGLNQLQVIQDEVAEMKEKGLPEEQINSMMTGQIMGVIPELIRQAEVKIDPLSISSELGKLEANMDFALQGIDADTPADPMFLLGAVSMDLNVSIDEPLLKQFVTWQLKSSDQASAYQGSEQSRAVEAGIPLNQKVTENIQGMVDENWLKKSRGVYTSKISMHQGELLINEKPVDPMQQIMSSMGGVDH